LTVLTVSTATIIGLRRPHAVASGGELGARLQDHVEGRLGDMGIADEAAQIVEQRRFFD
jgi:hypothetical protein